MEFQTLKGSRNKKIVIGVIVFITIISMILIGRSYASYRTTQSINIANGKINYKVPDLRVVAVKLQSESNSDTYNDSNTIPTSGYILNTSKSVCGQPDGNGYATSDSNIMIIYENGNISYRNLKKNTRCYLYFDIDNGINVTLAGINMTAKKGSTLVDSICADASCSGLYYVNDGMYGGTTYYYRGAVNNNWVKFAGMYWRIIRINGDGSIRMIYSGTTAPTSSTATVMTGTGTQTTTKAFNSSYNDAIYVGFKYASSNGHGTSTWSTIADYLVGTGSGGWYSSSGLSSYASYIADGKFCNDRTTNGSYFSNYTSTTGYGTSNTTFAPATRVFTSSWGWNGTQTISTSCSNSSDIFTTKVGLITLDEVLMAGGFGGTNNSSYYLYTNQAYRTMSPRNFDGNFANVFRVNTYGGLGSGDNYVGGTYGVRPVINLKAGTKFTGSGTYDDVYKVVGTSD